MATIVDMPKLSDTMTVGTLVNWLKNEGDKVAAGDMIAEVETDKATMELENFEDGVLLKQYIQAGQEVAIGAPICAIGEAGEEAPEAPAGGKSAAKAEEAPAAPAEANAPSPAVAAIKEAPVALAANGGRIKASPLAKRLAGEYGVAIEAVHGTGPGGRIVKADILAAKANGTGPVAVAPAATATPSAPAAMPATAAPVMQAADETIALSGMRKVIAQRLTESKTQVPHFYLDMEVNVGPMLELRSSLNKHLAELPAEQGGIKLTVNDFILKAVAGALVEVPAVNSSWQGDSIRRFGSANVAFGVAIEDGLVTPVIRDAQSKSLRQVSAEAKDLIAKARSKKLSPDAMSGSTFTVTNLGMFGVNRFFGIINTPNAAILSVGATKEVPALDKDGKLCKSYVMSVGFSGDHRVVDGADAAKFLASLKSKLENPALMLV